MPFLRIPTTEIPMPFIVYVGDVVTDYIHSVAVDRYVPSFKERIPPIHERYSDCLRKPLLCGDQLQGRVVYLGMWDGRTAWAWDLRNGCDAYYCQWFARIHGDEGEPVINEIYERNMVAPLRLHVEVLTWPF